MKQKFNTTISESNTTMKAEAERVAKRHDIQALINDKDAVLIYLDKLNGYDMDDFSGSNFIIESRMNGTMRDKYEIPVTAEALQALINSNQHYVVHNLYGRHTNIVAIRKDIVTKITRGDFSIWVGYEYSADIRLKIDNKFASHYKDYREIFKPCLNLFGFYTKKVENSYYFYVDTYRCNTNF